jgi:hypothetical protein
MHPDGCDHCGRIAELYHNETTGLALCDACDAAQNAADDAEPTPAAKLAARQSERAETGQPETLTDIRARARFAADWLADRAATHRRDYFDSGHADRVEIGMAIARDDAARILASIADALDALIGG